MRLSSVIISALLLASCAEGLPSSPSESVSREGGVDGSSNLPKDDAGSMEGVDSGSPGMMDAGTDSGPDPCMDGMKNGLESDTDCGGPKYDPCAAGDSCVIPQDCVSGMCDATNACTMAMPDAGAMSGDPCTTLTAPDPSCMCKAYMGKGYFFCTATKDWNAARTACMGAMSDLVAIEDMAEEMFIEPNVTANSWIGAANVGTTSWVWTATGKEFWNMMAVGGAFAKWQAGHPIAVAGWCAMMQTTAKTWVTMACTLPSGFICEQK